MTLALTLLLCLAAGSSVGSRSVAGGMGPPLERTCLPMCWTTAAVATWPPLGLGQKKEASALWPAGGTAEASLLRVR